MYTLYNNQLITINRGDTFNLPLFIQFRNVDSDYMYIKYFVKDDDVITLNIVDVNDLEGNQVILSKVGVKNENDDVVFHFDSEDTINIEAGTYCYEIKIDTTREGERVRDTIIPRRKFTILD